MASVAQVLANRFNAQKSTGPRSAEGKALVAQNAVKHGLLAQRVVVKGEDPEEFVLYREGMLEDLDPRGAVEGVLAERIVHLAWRLRRAERLEGAAFDVLEAQRVAKARAQPGANDVADDEEAVLARMVVEDFGDAKLLDQLLGYERRIENSLYRTMNELRKQRLLREVTRSEFRLQAGGESEVPASAVRTPPEGGTPNSRVNAELRTLPSLLSLPISNSALPTSSETPGGVTTNGAETQGVSCETKPEEVTGNKWQVTSEEAPESSASELLTSNVRLQTAGTSCETNPIAVGGLEDRGSCAEAKEEVGRGRPTREAPPEGGAPNGPSGETKPNEATSEKSQVTSQPG